MPPSTTETEVMDLLNKNTRTASYQAQGAETAEEIIGVLTAISVVSKRMAKKLALLEQAPARKEDGKRDAKPRRLSTHAD